MKLDTRQYRPFHLIERQPPVVEIHDPACDGPCCAHWREPDPIEAALTLRQIGNRVWLGIAIGHAVMFAYDPHGAWLALTTVFSGGR